jgi:hypothetical protein
VGKRIGRSDNPSRAGLGTGSSTCTVCSASSSGESTISSLSVRLKAVYRLAPSVRPRVPCLGAGRPGASRSASIMILTLHDTACSDGVSFRLSAPAGPVRDTGNPGPSWIPAPMRMRACAVRHTIPVRVIASDHRERGNLAVVPGNDAPNDCEIASVAPLPRNDPRGGCPELTADRCFLRNGAI